MRSYSRPGPLAVPVQLVAWLAYRQRRSGGRYRRLARSGAAHHQDIVRNNLAASARAEMVEVNVQEIHFLAGRSVLALERRVIWRAINSGSIRSHGLKRQLSAAECFEPSTIPRRPNDTRNVQSKTYRPQNVTSCIFQVSTGYDYRARPRLKGLQLISASAQALKPVTPCRAAGTIHRQVEPEPS